MLSKIESDLFSPTENKMLKILGKKKMSIAEITDKLYTENKIMNASIVVSGMIIRINKKAAHHKLKWFLNGMGMGRAGKTIWLDEAK